MWNFDTAAEMLQVFEKAQVPVRTNAVKVGESEMVFISAYPYSGAATIDLYCYDLQADGVFLRLFTYVYSPSERQLQFVVDGQQVFVSDGRHVIMKLAEHPQAWP